ncbi:MAG: hypothetical protein H7301_05060 [Cryobacterium sp.]|nr:hypothetical protein [Oligoflexia bacterium]
MVLKRAEPKDRNRYGTPQSFRLDDEVAVRLKVLKELLNKSQALIIEELVNAEYGQHEKRQPKELAVARTVVIKKK